MADKKIIAVTGATGSQGGGLVRAILADPNGGFAARAITRDASKDKSKALAAAGAEVVSGDLDDVESLKKAFAGAHGVYAVTNFWEHFSGEKEIQQAKNIAEAAKAAGVKHVIWSTLEDTRKLMSADDTRMPMLQGKYRVPHFDAKADANAAFSGLPTTFLVTSFYWDNFYLFGLAPKKDDKGVYSWTFPMGEAKLPGIAAEDIGKVAYGIFKAGSEYIGKTVGIAGESLSFQEMSKRLEKGLGISPVQFNPVDANVFRGFGFPGADEYGNMFQVYRDFEKEVNAARSIDLSRKLNPSLQSFDQWLAGKKSAVMAAANPAPADRITSIPNSQFPTSKTFLGSWELEFGSFRAHVFPSLLSAYNLPHVQIQKPRCLLWRSCGLCSRRIPSHHDVRSGEASDRRSLRRRARPASDQRQVRHDGRARVNGNRSHHSEWTIHRCRSSRQSATEPVHA